MALTSFTCGFHPCFLGHGPKSPISPQFCTPRPSLSYSVDIIISSPVSWMAPDQCWRKSLLQSCLWPHFLLLFLTGLPGCTWVWFNTSPCLDITGQSAETVTVTNPGLLRCCRTAPHQQKHGLCSGHPQCPGRHSSNPWENSSHLSTFCNPAPKLRAVFPNSFLGEVRRHHLDLVSGRVLEFDTLLLLHTLSISAAP